MIPWHHSSSPRYFVYVEDEPQAWSNEFYDLAEAVASCAELVRERHVDNGAGEGLVFDRVEATVVAAFCGLSDVAEGNLGIEIAEECNVIELSEGLVVRACLESA